jgi:hypothetical protein
MADAGLDAAPGVVDDEDDASESAPTPEQEDSGQPETSTLPLDATVAVDAKVVATRPDLPALCLRPGDDEVRDLFCGELAPGITGLRQLQELLSLNLIPKNADEAKVVEYEPDPATLIDQMVVLSYSTALAGRLVSALNPRILLLGQNTFMAFQRGVQQVELAAFDRADNELNLYLVTFSQACNAAGAGCLPGDLYTLDIERDWLRVEVHDDEDLKNTPSDCRQCHQRVRQRPMLLMRELKGPWTHFFGGPDDLAVKAYRETKGKELYAGVPSWAMPLTAGGTLQNRVELTQPLEFDTPLIEEELAAQDPASGARRSSTWDAAYQAFKRGEQLPLPYFEPFPADPEKQAKLSLAYQRYRANQLPKHELPDLADIYPDDPKKRAEIGLQTEPDAAPADLLIQACGPCHNDALDQKVSRARFNIALGRMSREELDVAIGRLTLPALSAGVMPPPEVRQLDAAGRTRLVEYLKQASRPAADETQLDAASRVGMAKDPWNGLIIYTDPDAGYTHDAGYQR